MGKVYPQTSRSTRGSTTTRRNFRAARSICCLLRRPRNLRMKTMRKVFCDEVDEYEDDLEGQGDPLMLIARAAKIVRRVRDLETRLHLDADGQGRVEDRRKYLRPAINAAGMSNVRTARAASCSNGMRRLIPRAGG